MSQVQETPRITRDSCPPSVSPSVTQKYFKLFPYLHDELKMTILSYVAYAPFETMPEHYPKSPLTDELPLISRLFRSMSNSDVLWKDAIVRISKKEPRLWRPALRSIIAVNNKETRDTTAVLHRDETILSLVERTHKTLHGSVSAPTSIGIRNVYKSIFETVVNQHLRFKGPVFIMPGQVVLGHSYALHLFEYRYRLLIAEVMLHQPSTARNGGRLDPEQPPVYFIHANRTPLERAAPVVLVQVLQCQTYPDGRADVLLLPVHFMWLERMKVRPNSGDMYDAQCLKMGSRVTAQMNHLQRQEALATTLDRVAGTMFASDDEEEDETEDVDDDNTEDDSSEGDDDVSNVDDDDIDSSSSNSDAE